MSRTGSMRAKADGTLVGVTMDGQSPRTTRLQDRMQNMGGVATPLAMSMSATQSPTTVTQRPDHIPISTIPEARMYEVQYPYGGQQRKVASEGQLLNYNDDSSLHVIDNLPELAGSPQRSIYTWREGSPAYPRFTTGSHPTSPVATPGNPEYYTSYAQQAVGRRTAPPMYRQINATLPTNSPQMRRKGPFSSESSPSRFQNQQQQGMTFSRALQMSDSLELSAARVGEGANPNQKEGENRRSVYEMNYEISV